MGAQEIDDIPDLEIGNPPAYQPGDSERVEVEVGQLRQALWYFEMYHELIDFSEELTDFAKERVGDIIVLEEAVEEIEKENDLLRTLLFISGGVIGAGVIGGLLLAVFR